VFWGFFCFFFCPTFLPSVTETFLLLPFSDLRGNYFRLDASISACAIQVHGNENSSRTGVLLILPDFLSCMLLRCLRKKEKSTVYNLKEINGIFTSAVIVLRINVTLNSFFYVTHKALSSLYISRNNKL